MAIDFMLAAIFLFPLCAKQQQIFFTYHKIAYIQNDKKKKHWKTSKKFHSSGKMESNRTHTFQTLEKKFF